jgi:hypothetical protein
MELDYHISDYRLAVTRVIQKHHLKLGQFAGEPQAGSPRTIPLEARPLLLTADPLEVTHVEQAWLALALLLLCCCPCVGPAPVGAILLFACWTRKGRYDHVASDDYDEEGLEDAGGIPGAGQRRDVGQSPGLAATPGMAGAHGKWGGTATFAVPGDGRRGGFRR